jgi:hypothetical protein
MTESQLVGDFRITHEDYNDMPIAVLMEKHAYEFAVGTTAPTDRQTQPTIKKKLSTILREDDKLCVYAKLDSAITENGTTNATFTWSIPITFRNKSKGNAFEKTLTYSDMTTTGCDVPTNSKVWAASKWYKLGYYQVPAQSEVKLGHNLQDNRVDSKIILFSKFTI